LTFNDLEDEGKRPERFPPNDLWMRQKNQVKLQPRLFWEESRWSNWGYRLTGLGPELFQSAGALGVRPSWRSLTLEVAPEGVTGFWEEKTFVGRLSARELGPEVRKSLEKKRQDQPEEPHFRGLEPDFVPRGSLGLYVSRGSASFRCVVLQPLNVSE